MDRLPPDQRNITQLVIAVQNHIRKVSEQVVKMSETSNGREEQEGLSGGMGKRRTFLSGDGHFGANVTLRVPSLQGP